MLLASFAPYRPSRGKPAGLTLTPEHSGYRFTPTASSATVDAGPRGGGHLAPWGRVVHRRRAGPPSFQTPQHGRFTSACATWRCRARPSSSPPAASDRTPPSCRRRSRCTSSRP
jgi:hypothetical protein